MAKKPTKTFEKWKVAREAAKGGEGGGCCPETVEFAASRNWPAEGRFTKATPGATAIPKWPQGTSAAGNEQLFVRIQWNGWRTATAEVGREKADN